MKGINYTMSEKTYHISRHTIVEWLVSIQPEPGAREIIAHCPNYSDALTVKRALQQPDPRDAVIEKLVEACEESKLVLTEWTDYFQKENGITLRSMSDAFVLCTSALSEAEKLKESEAKNG